MPAGTDLDPALTARGPLSITGGRRLERDKGSPAFNESAVIARTVAPLIRAGYTVIMVDDGSTDRTWEALRDLPIVRLRHPVNLGQGAALQTGIDYALGHGTAAVVTFDADGQHDALQIPALLWPIRAGQADVVLGSRFLRPPDAKRVPWLRRWLLKGAICVSGLLTRVWLTDAHNGFRALSRRAAERIRLRESGFAHATEILEQIRRAGLRYREVATTVDYSDYSRAKGQRSSACVNILIDLVLRRIFG
jgi:glycosyltransferase involved in cell wall biosynthesis